MFMDSAFFRSGLRYVCWLVLVGLMSSPLCRAQGSSTSSDAVGSSAADGVSRDPYSWLEDVNGARSMAWVKAENERSAKVLEADPRFAVYQAQALKVVESPDRLPYPDLREGTVYNTWQDAEHVRGIFRKTSLADYQTAQPHWQTVIDYDALGKADNQKWVHKGLNCLYPGVSLCLVGLSDGGEDATTLREFDLRTGKFVAGGFVLPKSKQTVSWLDENTLMLARDWGPGTMTTSGYPFVVKMLKRGQKVEEAKEIYRGKETDTSAGADLLHDAQGHRAVILSRRVSFFTQEFSLWSPDGAVKRIHLPGKCDINGLLDGQMVVTLDEGWTPEGGKDAIAEGSVISLDLAAVEKDPVHLKPAVVFAPTAREFAQEGVEITKNYLLMTTLDHVQGRVYRLSWDGKAWKREKLNVADNLSVDVMSANSSDDKFFLLLRGFLTPSSLSLGDAATGEMKVVKSEPAQFDASKDVVEQLEATSKDGTKVPYFVVHRGDIEI